MFLEILLCAHAATVAFAQEGETRLSDPRPAAEEEGPRAFHGGFHMELRDEHDLRDRPQNRDRQELHELSVEAGYHFDPRVDALVELSLESWRGKQELFAKQALIDWRPWVGYTRVRLGQQFLPVGLINPRDNWFSSNPPFMQKLFTESKGIDLGAVLDVYPLAADHLAYLEGGVFAGRFARAEDEREDAPQRAPRVLSLKSHSGAHDAFLTYFEHDLAFADPVKAWGGGFELRSNERRPVKGALLAEFWRIDQLQTLGPNQRDDALLLYGEVEWWRLKLGWRWSQERGRLISAVGHDALPVETSRLYALDFKITPEFSLRAERVSETQDEILRDEWVGRALLDWRL